MIGTIIGDTVGSRFEFNNYRSKQFNLFDDSCCFTDDSVLALAVAKSVLETDGKNLSELTIKNMQELAQKYPDCSYGTNFMDWIWSDNPKPYNSFGNGSAMRVAACGWAGETLEEVKKLSHKVTEVTHNHPEGIKGAEATAVAVFLARTGSSIDDIIKHIEANYYDHLGQYAIGAIRDTYEFDVTCQGTIPVALEAFFESRNFEDALRTAISVGGDSDTLAAITCAVAEAYYGVPEHIRKDTEKRLPKDLLKILHDFEKKYPPKVEQSFSEDITNLKITYQ